MLFIKNWMNIDGPFKIVKYDNLLYPQYEDRFNNKISAEIHNDLIQKAKEKLKNDINIASDNVIQH